MDEKDSNNKTENVTNSTTNQEQTTSQSVTHSTDPQGPVFRENLVSTAVHFLQNPRVRESPLTQKRAFLLKKGLSVEEIDAAIERAAVYTKSLTTSVVAQPPQIQQSSIPPPVPPYGPRPMTFWLQTRSLAASIALVGSIAYGVYIVYKKHVEPRLFGQYPKPKHPLVIIQEHVAQLCEAVKVIQTDIKSIEENIQEKFQTDMEAMKNEIKKLLDDEIVKVRANQPLTLQEIRSDVESIKGILLNRRQFAIGATTPSIPAWQLNSEKTEVKNGNETVEAKENSCDNQNGIENVANGSPVASEEAMTEVA